MLAAAALGILLQSAPPEGFRSFENKAKGLAIHVPITFEEIPIPPNEELMQLKFTEKKTGQKGDFRAEIWVVSLEKGAITTGQTQDEPPEAKAETRPAGRRPVRTLPEFVKQRMRDWNSAAKGNVDGGPGKKKLDRFSLTSSSGSLRFEGAAYVVDLPDRTICVLGITSQSEFPDLEKKFERAAKSLRVTEASDKLAGDVELHYKLHPFRNVDYRKEVRRNLAKGWKAEDTDNFILIYDTEDKILLSKIKNDLEVVRTKYLELFPPVKPIEAVSTVRVCKDVEEFIKFSGAPRGVAGFWNSSTQELVFYDATAGIIAGPGLPKGYNEQEGRNDSIVVLYHEAFHQFIYYSCGEIAPHSWFNEGFGDFFSGSRIGGGGKRVDAIGVNPWRVGTAKKMVKEGENAPLKDLVRFEQPKYYEKGGFYYAQGWSLIYFLNESKLAKKHPVWSKILPVYLKTLCDTYASAREKLGEKPKPELRAAAQFEARVAAADAAFKDVNFDELEKAWKEFVSGLVDPRAK